MLRFFLCFAVFLFASHVYYMLKKQLVPDCRTETKPRMQDSVSLVFDPLSGEYRVDKS
ncbi:MAG: hypothetical protein JSC161_000459 [Candidatus Tokpelaia sp. JSC161]|jgi:hypothetical protein|nr:MAG: hypothetical protein JSC161_000459 [Candidatus Tokpelaia sp. JSC161]